MLAIEEVREFVANELRKQLQHLIGEPHDPEQIRKTVQDAILPIYRSLGVSPNEAESKSLSDILVVGFLGMSEDFDPKALLENISDRTLGLLADRLGEATFPGNLFGLEWLKRQGNICDWSFCRENAHAANLSIIPRYSINHIAADILSSEEKN
jgi:hypothetical protein